MKDYSKKLRQMLFLSNSKKIVILGVTCCLLVGGLFPTINNVFIKDIQGPSETFKGEDNKDDSEYKKTNYDNYVYASFYWSPRSPDPGESVTFYSTSHVSNGHISSLRWDFYDGTKGYGYMTSHTFEKKGSYRITLSITAWDFDDGYHWYTSTNYVTVGADPFPKITFTPENPSPAEKVTLDASESKDPDGKINYYTWSYHNIEDPRNVTKIGSNKKIYYTWEKQGIYIVSLFIEDNNGNNNTIETTIRVSILKLVGFPKRSKGLSFEISNHGNYTADNLKWSVELDKYYFLAIRSKCLYRKNGTILNIGPDSSQRIEIKDIRRAFRKIKLYVTVKADNAVEVSKSFYGLVFGKRIYLSEENFVNPYNVIIISGTIIALIIGYIYNYK